LGQEKRVMISIWVDRSHGGFTEKKTTGGEEKEVKKSLGKRIVEQVRVEGK